LIRGVRIRLFAESRNCVIAFANLASRDVFRAFRASHNVSNANGASIGRKLAEAQVVVKALRHRPQTTRELVLQRSNLARVAPRGAIVLVAILVVLVADVASAQDTAQKIDGAKYCDAMSGMFNSATEAQKMIRDGCLKNEADYAAKLTRVWTKVPEEDRVSCQKLLAMSQSSNQGLAGCLSPCHGQALSRRRHAWLQIALRRPVSPSWWRRLVG
jgi:hypothetical protein